MKISIITKHGIPMVQIEEGGVEMLVGAHYVDWRQLVSVACEICSDSGNLVEFVKEAINAARLTDDEKEEVKNVLAG